MKKLWRDLAPRTKRRYTAQGVSPQRYNSAVKRGLRGDRRAEYLGVERGVISGVTGRDPYSVIREAILLQRPDGTRMAWGKEAGPIRWQKIRERVEKQSEDLLKHIRKARRYESWEEYHDYLMEHDDYDKDDDPLWYND